MGKIEKGFLTTKTPRHEEFFGQDYRIDKIF